MLPMAGFAPIIAAMVLAAADPTPVVTTAPTCLDVLARAFAEQGREQRADMLRRLGAQLGMTPSALEQLLAGRRGTVEYCFNLLTDRAR